MRVALMTDQSDGDCGNRPENKAAINAVLESLSARPERFVRVRQVHGARVLDVDGKTAGERDVLPEADGMISGEPGTALGLSVADCAPVLLYDPVSGGVAALHAGRKGTFENIARAGVQAMRARFDSKPAQILALIGPCAGPCCYEVSAAMALAWRDAGLPARGRRLDIGAANHMQLENAGVFRHNIYVVSHCTVCSGVFFSYRAAKTLNRNLVLVMP